MEITTEILKQYLANIKLKDMKEINDQLQRKLIYINVKHLKEEGKFITNSYVFDSFNKWKPKQFKIISEHLFIKKSIDVEVIQLEQ